MIQSTKTHGSPNRRTRAALAALVAVVIIAAGALSSRDVSSQESDTRRDLEKVFRQHERLSLDPGQIVRQVKQTRSLTLATSRGTFEMTLEPRDMRAPGYVAEAWGDKGVRVLERAPVRTYRGTVRGLPNAQVRMTIDEGTVEGLIITEEELFFLEPAKRYAGTAAKNDFVFYASSDVKQSAGECGNTMAEMVAQHSASVSNQASVKGPQPEEVFGPAMDIDIALEADFEYFTNAGGGTEAGTVGQINTIMNEVEGIYEFQLGLKFNILNTRVWTSDTDPYTSSAPSTLLNQFRSSYNSSAPAQAAGRDVAHLFTGRELDGSTIGIAFQPGVDCPFDTQGFAYGLSQNIVGNRAGLTAHEIGHNFSASHVSSAQGSDCGDPGTATTSIMNPSISSSTNFCQFSRDELTNHANATRACLTPLTQPGCTYSLSATTQNLPSSAGGNTINVMTQAGCNWATAEGAGWLTVTGGASGTGNGTVSYSVTANDGICGPRTAFINIGGQVVTVTQAGKPDYLTDPNTATAISLGQTLNGNLSSSDCPTVLAPRANAYMDRYKFNGTAGQNIRIEMNAAIPPQSGGLDTYLYLIFLDGTPNGNIVYQNDDIVFGDQTNSRIPCITPCGQDFYTLPHTGTYIIVATSFSNGDTGAYSLALTLFSPLAQEANTSAAAALNSVTFAATSNPSHTAFRIVDPYNFSSDQITRLILFTPDLGLPSQQNPSPTGPNALLVSAGGQPLVVENVGPITFPGLNASYVVVALKRIDGQPLLQNNQPANLAFTVTCRNKSSTSLSITIAP